MLVHFRKCLSSDLDELVEISRKTFVDAFEKDNDPEDFKNYITIAFDRARISEQLENFYSSFYFAFQGEHLVGYFKLNEDGAQTDINSKESIELERIYILEEFQGKQIGKQIILEALKLANQRGKEYMWLGVWQKNTDAIRFYEKHGFYTFDTHPYYIGKDKQTDWLMRYDL